jgi:hypothetical protein
MKDIDFEELDRAVSSLIGTPGDAKNTTTSAKPADEDSPAPADDTQDTAPEANSEEHEPEAKPEEPHDAIVPASPLISSGKKSGGRFMDVVHPSTNMAKPDAPKPSKTGKVLHPISDTVKPESEPQDHLEHKLHKIEPIEDTTEPEDSASAEATEDKQISVEESTHEEAVHVDTGEPQAHDESPKEDVEPKTEASKDEPKWPDPLDLMKQEDPKPEEANPDEHHEIAPDAPDPLAVQTESSSSSAPFLPDAKVEKRPLGAFSNEGEGSEPKAESDQQGITPDQNGASSDLQQPAIAQKLPPELEGDIVNVELSEASGPQSEPEPTPDEAQKLEDHEKEQLANDDDVKQDEHKEDKPEHAGQAAAGAAVLTQTMSIPKQYQSADEHPDTAEHPVFDTKEYHPPIDPHAEHASKHTIWWVIAAVILLAGTAIAFGYWVLNGL